MDELRLGHLQVVDSIYGAVTDPARWSEVAQATTQMLGGGATGILHRSGPHLVQQNLLATDLDPAFKASYEQYYAGINPWAERAVQRRSPVVDDTMLCPASELERTEFYADWLRPLALKYALNACVQLGPHETIELSSLRLERLGSIEQSEYDIFASLLPHLGRAVELSRRFRLAETEVAASNRAMEHSGVGLILVDAECRVVSCNPEAERILSNGGLVVRNGRLRGPSIVDADLAQAVARATGGGRVITGRSGSLLRVPRPAGRLPLSVAIGPVDERDRPFGVAGPLAMAAITDPERGTRPSEEGLRALFDLTAAEAKLVAALCAGETLANYSEATGTSLNTVKTHLKHVFDKTGETRQADLIRRIANDVALRFGAERV